MLRSIGVRLRLALATMGTALAAAAVSAVALSAIVDVNPDVSDNANANASTGGRINAGLANASGNNQLFYAASEYGGLFRTTDGGNTWVHLDGHTPQFTWDVEVDPANNNRVYATSWGDGRVAPRSGIQVSTDGGNTWAQPPTSYPNPALEGTGNDNTPQAGFSCATNGFRTEPTAFGIGIRPDAAQNVFVGTACGLARSTDSGVTWQIISPATTGVPAAGQIWDVVVQAGGPSGQGIVDICGDVGHLRSTDGGNTWTGGTGLPTGRCSIAASPDESYVLFVVAVDNNVYESDDAGATWTNLGQNSPQGRIPFVVTNQRSNDGMRNRFDLWYSDTQLFSADCTTPATPAQGGANRCPGAGTWTNQQAGAHWDAGDLAFDSGAAVDACPRIYTTDGGAHRNTDLGADCQNPNWARSNVGLHALWLWTMSGANRAGAGEDLYFGTQDNGTFATITGDSNPPTWTNPNCCDTFDMVATPTWVLGTTCCFNTGRFNRLQLANANYAGAAEINTYPAGNINGFSWGRKVDTWGGTNAVLLTSAGVFVTANIQANPIVWTQLGAATTPANACGVWASQTGGTPTFYVQTNQCTGRGSDQLWSHQGAAAGGTWNRIDNNGGITGGIGVFAVDPNNPNRLYASNLNAAGPRMIFSTDGGTNWDRDLELDTLMTGSGAFLYQTGVAPSTNNGGARARFQGYPQPSLLAYSAVNGNVLAAGGQDSGVFVSTDGGANWGLVTDPFGVPPAAGKPHLPRPRFAYFDDEPAGWVTVYVGTQGRGVWRLSLRAPTADAGGPYVTPEGTDVVLSAAGSSDPDGGALTYAWDFDNDGLFDDATGVAPTFTDVGQDGAFPVSVRVTDPEGMVAVDSATVTVTNVAPSVSLGSNAPKPENSPVTVTGTISDPGWEELLTATIDWGDGSSEAIAGVLENVRPDATLVFSIAHTYGDNGTFTATVCGKDDDTQTCQAILLTITNVDPTATIDESGATVINGVPAIIAQAGDPVTFNGRSTDPGSDDLAISWDWDDGPPAPDVTTSYLVNPPAADPLPSPSIQPRDVTDTKIHAFGQACMYDVGLRSVDDDGGSGSDTVKVLIAGNALLARSAGYWQNAYRDRNNATFDTVTLECYLEIAAFVSLVFNEVRDASTIAKAFDVLRVNNQSTDTEQLDRQLLAALLNFANGAIGWSELVDTDGNGTADTAFSAVIAVAEAVRLNPLATKAQLVAQKNILERINLSDE